MWESEQGRTEYGLRLLDRAEGLAATENHGLLFLQRGRIFTLTGRGGEALRMLDSAIPCWRGIRRKPRTWPRRCSTAASPT